MCLGESFSGALFSDTNRRVEDSFRPYESNERLHPESTLGVRLKDRGDSSGAPSNENSSLLNNLVRLNFSSSAPKNERAANSTVVSGAGALSSSKLELTKRSKKSRSGSRQRRHRPARAMRIGSIVSKDNSLTERSPKISSCAFWSHKTGCRKQNCSASQVKSSKSLKKHKPAHSSELRREVNRAKQERSQLQEELGLRNAQLSNLEAQGRLWEEERESLAVLEHQCADL